MTAPAKLIQQLPELPAGWDYSTRWFANNMNLTTIRTTKVLPAGAQQADSVVSLVSLIPAAVRLLCELCMRVGRLYVVSLWAGMRGASSSPPAHTHAFVLPCRSQRLAAANGAEHRRLCRHSGLHRASAAVPAAGGQQVSGVEWLVEERSNGWRQRKIAALPLDKLDAYACNQPSENC